MENLCKLNAISGNEHRAAGYILNELKKTEGITSVEKDPLGNIIVFKKGKKTPEKKMLLSAHMDEVGFIVTYICENGNIKASPVGGIDPASVVGKRLFAPSCKKLVIPIVTPMHHLSAEGRKTVPSTESLEFFTGCSDRQEAEKSFRVGDSLCFENEQFIFGNDCFKSKAIDDRAGCAVLLEILKRELEYDTYFAFCVQEEVGLRGSSAVAQRIQPDIVIVVEATTAGDLPNVYGADKCCTVGGGAVVSFMDNATVYNRRLYNICMDYAKKKNIPVQTKTRIAGGNDAGSYQNRGGGAAVLAISVPCRYIHSPSCVINLQDFENVTELTAGLTTHIQNQDKK